MKYIFLAGKIIRTSRSLVQYIYAQRITCAGEFESHFTIATGADNDELIWKNASLAYNATNDEYFVVYTVDALSDQTH